MIDNKNKVAVVFGVRNESSIAFQIALKLHLSGCRVAVSYTKETKDEVLAILKAHEIESITQEVDVRNEQEIADFLNAVYNTWGPINYLLHGVAFGNQNVICNSFYGSDEAAPSYIDIPFEDLMDSFNISAYSLLRICRVAEPLLTEKASILTLTYNASQRVFPDYAGMSINKAALENIMKFLSHYFRKSKVRVNAISAGLVMTTSSGGISGVRKLRKIGKVTAPLGNVTAQDVADTAIYYFSDLSTKVSGNIHFTDGGFNIMGIVIDEE
ncbi:enoyl-ACP reductase FabI [Pedobacter cryophilus]|uniref:Enoyl-[acyl-carrier-protein] reductase [NADH] n=1 Tax=Pedobacter cryophilus TaxID=2571271 RepID=A0A4U1C9F7_9SPHI|nr:SDR family oxidoreductase [Pedobacter cryophilus]TKC00278.1 SDR family oxidoreductase [Pedobacter cryophilus]